MSSIDYYRVVQSEIDLCRNSPFSKVQLLQKFGVVVEGYVSQFRSILLYYLHNSLLQLQKSEIETVMKKILPVCPARKIVRIL